MTHKFDSGIHDLSVCKKILSILTFLLYIPYTYGTLADAWVKKGKHLESQKSYMDPLIF